MLKFLATLAAALPLLLAAAPGRAQSATGQPYAGPRYPGGPDSLRALVGRATRFAASPVRGRMLVQFELTPTGQPTSFTLIRSPAPLNKPLVEATARALDYIEAHMLAWQPAPLAPAAPNAGPPEPPQINLLIDFAAPDAPASPYVYADENPVFSTLDNLLRQQIGAFPGTKALLDDPAKMASFQSFPEGLSRALQLLAR